MNEGRKTFRAEMYVAMRRLGFTPISVGAPFKTGIADEAMEFLCSTDENDLA